MTQFHAVMIDETGCEFGVSFTAPSRDDAYDYLAEQYPESRCTDLADSDMIRQREEDRYARMNDEYEDMY